MCYLCNCNQQYIHSFPHRTGLLLDSVSTTQSTVTLVYNTQQTTKFLVMQPIKCHAQHTENLLHPSTCDLCLSQPVAFVHRNYGFACLDHELPSMWADFRASPCAINLCLPHVLIDHGYHALCMLCIQGSLMVLLALMMHINFVVFTFVTICMSVMCYRYLVNSEQCAVYQQQCCDHHGYWDWQCCSDLHNYLQILLLFWTTTRNSLVLS